MSSERQTNLYHCTKSDSLIKILGSKYFRYSYCLEEDYGRKDNGFNNELLAYAMVCFADLYTNELWSHTHQFNADSYIIMEKSWAKEKRICPVLYYNRDSLSNWAFLAMIKYILDINKDFVSLYATKEYGRINENVGVLDRIWDNADKLHKSLELFRPFFKRYEGCYFLKNEGRFSDEPTEFFLEREWRSFPVVQNREKIYLSEKEYRDQNTLNNAVKELERNNKLEFQWKDIKKIGCKKEKKAEVIKTIKDSFDIDAKEIKNKIVLLNRLKISMALPMHTVKS